MSKRRPRLSAGREAPDLPDLTLLESTAAMQLSHGPIDRNEALCLTCGVSIGRRILSSRPLTAGWLRRSVAGPTDQWHLSNLT
jgi:hypothetical protein